MKLKDKYLPLISLGIILIFSYFLLGLVGLRTVAGIFILFLIPPFLILSRFDLPADEKLFFGFFIGLSWVAFAVFLVNRIIPSFRLSIVITLIISLVIYFALRGGIKWKSKKLE